MNWDLAPQAEVSLHQALMDTISGEKAAQLNFWKNTDCVVYEERRLNNAYVGDKTEE